MKWILRSFDIHNWMECVKIINIRKELSLNFSSRCRYLHTIWQKDAKIVYTLVWIPAASPEFEPPEHAIALRGGATFMSELVK